MSIYKATRAGIDSAGGGIISAIGQGFVKIDSALWAVVGDIVASHGDSPHNAAVMTQGSNFIRINGIPVCREGNLASCGHTATGSGHVKVQS